MSDQPPRVLGCPQLRTIAMPSDTNAGGSIFGSWTLSQMDLAGGTLAAERPEGKVSHRQHRGHVASATRVGW